jgi:hypothetical protein
LAHIVRLYTREDSFWFQVPQISARHTTHADLALPAVVKAMALNATSWEAVASFCEHIMLQKETAERIREVDPVADLSHRRRPGRRWRQHGLMQPLGPSGGVTDPVLGAPSPAPHTPVRTELPTYSREVLQIPEWLPKCELSTRRGRMPWFHGSALRGTHDS